MARFIKESNIINQKIRENIDLALNDFTVKIGGKPTYCHYFHRDSTMTEADPVLNTVYKTVGTSSPVVYKEIENFPVYGLEQLNLDMQEGEYGFEAESEQEVIILPNTISPLPDDFVAVPLLNNDKDHSESYIMFRVTKVVPSILGSKQFWQVTLELSDKTYRMFQEQVKANLVFSGEDYKEGRQSILFRESFLLLQYNREYRYKFLLDYVNQYTDHRVNELGVQVANSTVIDYSLKAFFNESKLFDREKNSDFPKYMDFSNVRRTNYVDLRKQYSISLYHKILNGFDDRDPDDKFLTAHDLIDLRSDGDHNNNIFKHFDSAFYRVYYCPVGFHDFIKPIIGQNDKPEITLLERIKKNIPYELDEDLNFLITFFNTDRFNNIRVLDDQKVLVDNLLYRTNRLMDRYSVFSYFFVPILLHFMSVVEDQIMARETL